MQTIKDFFFRNFDVKLRNMPIDETKTQEYHFLFLPPPDLSLVYVDADGNEKIIRDLSQHQLVTDEYKKAIERNFERLFFDARNEQVLGPVVTNETPLAQLVFEDYIGLLMRSAVDRLMQIARDRQATEPEMPPLFSDVLREFVPTTGASPASDIGSFASRFLLHGLALPEPKEPDKKLGSLYSLMGLQVELVPAESKDARIGLNINTVDPQWLTLESDPIRSGKIDETQLNALVSAAGSLDALLDRMILGADPIIVRSRAMEWGAGERLDFEADQKKYSIWRLTSDMVALLANRWVSADPGQEDPRKGLTLCVRERANRDKSFCRAMCSVPTQR
jgi:hypothetical protein